MIPLTIPQTFDLAVQHHQAGRLQEAEQLYRQILAQQPKHAGALHYLGLIAYRARQTDVALDLLHQAITLEPNWPDAYSNLAMVLQATGKLDQAIAAYRQALALQPDYPEVHYNLGTALKDNGQLDQAIAAWRAAVALKPDFAEPYYNLGNALKDTGQIEPAIAAYRQVLTLKPSHLDAASNLVLTMHYHPGIDAAAIAQEHRRWNQQHAEPSKNTIQPHPNDRDPDRRLRIGYVSPDFNAHPVGRLLLPLLANHDRRQVEAFAYAQVSAPDAMTERLRGHTDAWRSLLGLSDSQAADRIRQDRIDILVDLAGHTGGNRLLVFARKPAPVQATFLGYPNTTGLTSIDYRLTDAFADPPGRTELYHTEQLLRLSPSAWCFQPTESPPLTPRPDGPITFGCLNMFCKLNDFLLDLWAQILPRVPGARLLLLAEKGAHRQRTLNRLCRDGLDPACVEFIPRLSRPEYLALYHRIDLALDCYPYHGTATTCDALWMGVPVVTLAGPAHVSRVGVSLLSNAGLPELVTPTPDEYVRLAVELAGDLPRLRQLRATLRQRMQASPLMDAAGYARNIESAYRQMWHRWCASVSAA